MDFPAFFEDQCGRRIHLAAQPRRIVSLVPSQTELLFSLGLDAAIVGVTKFCIHPAQKVRDKPKIGGTKKLHLDQIAALAPDLILANKEENERSQVEALAARFPVWTSDISTLPQALDMIRRVGALTATEAPAAQLASDIETAFAHLQPLSGPRRVAYLIWKNPWMTVGHDTFIHDLITRAGWINVFGDLGRYPEIDADLLAGRAPDAVFLSSEPYPFKAAHLAELQVICPAAEIRLVDGELFSWYGSRLLASPDYLRSIQ